MYCEYNAGAEMKYTAIYRIGMANDVIKVARLILRNNESVKDMLDRIGISSNTSYLFNGWPTFVGAENDEIKETPNVTLQKFD